MSGLHEKFDEIVAGVPVYGDLDRAIEQAERERRRRYGAIAGLAAAAAVLAVIVGVLAVSRDGDNSQPPIGPVTTPSRRHPRRQRPPPGSRRSPSAPPPPASYSTTRTPLATRWTGATRGMWPLPRLT